MIKLGIERAEYVKKGGAHVFVLASFPKYRMLTLYCFAEVEAMYVQTFKASIRLRRLFADVEIPPGII